MRDFIGREPTEKTPGNGYEYEKAKQGRETDCFYDIKFVQYEKRNVPRRKRDKTFKKKQHSKERYIMQLMQWIKRGKRNGRNSKRAQKSALRLEKDNCYIGQ